MPVGRICIHEIRGHALEEHICAEAQTTHSKRGIDLILRGCESSDTFCETLTDYIVNLLLRERAGLAQERRDGSDSLGENQIGIAYQSVVFGEHGNNILVELYAGEHNQHTDQIRGEETQELADTDMLPQQLY